MYLWVGVYIYIRERALGVEQWRRIQAGGSAWGKVEGAVTDRNTFRTLNEKVLNYYVGPASKYGWGTVALTEQKHERLPKSLSTKNNKVVENKQT